VQGIEQRTGRLLIGGRLRAGSVRFEKGRIVELRLGEGSEAGSGHDLPILAPGLVDLHVHGSGGFEPLHDLAGMARALARAGTTAFQPTLFPQAPQPLGADCERAWAQVSALGPACARVVGLHLEGPFLNPSRAGALQQHELAPPSVAGLRAILGPATGSGRGIRTMTLAPELSGAADLIAELVRCGVRVSLGHSAASAKEARTALRSGARGATHLFNAMAPLHHRELGLAGAALLEGDLQPEIIGDLVHVGPDALALALRSRGARGLCLVSDSLRGTGTGCNVFHERGRAHHDRGGAWYFPPERAGGEFQLGGSAMTQLQMVQRLVTAGVLSPEEALTMASAAPAAALGMEGELGTLAVGARADLLVLEPGILDLREVLLGGVPVR
jgi:N-acetylglucosamine-6-phosphate deacetylase